jgi:hypothetical protein
MRRYAGQNEVRFKVTDRDVELYRETAWYLYENHVIDKPNIQSFGQNRYNNNLHSYHIQGTIIVNLHNPSKPTIYEYARWCMKQAFDYTVNMFQWKFTRYGQMQEQQNMMLGNH